MPRDGASNDAGEPQLEARHISQVKERAVVGAEVERWGMGYGECGPRRRK